MKKLEDYIITIPDFPTKGVMFRDITSLLEDADGLRLAVDMLKSKLEKTDFDVIVGPESRGFIFGMPLAYLMHKPFVPIRKAGKLPRETIMKTYSLEYGTASLEIHKDSIKKGSKVVIVDDLMATGGTARAMTEMVEELGCVVTKILFVMELKGLEGRKALSGYDVEAVISYEGI